LLKPGQFASELKLEPMRRTGPPSPEEIAESLVKQHELLAKWNLPTIDPRRSHDGYVPSASEVLAAIQDADAGVTFRKRL
jgi:hypothetical protein